MDHEKISFIRHYQNSIEKSQNDSGRVLHCLKKLQNLKINVQDLQETGIGKTVNSLRKLDGEAGELATKLVTKWKDQISKMNDSEPHAESPPQPHEKDQHKESKKLHHSKSSSSGEYSDSNIKKSSKSHSSSTSNHQHSSSSNHHHTSHSSDHKEKDHKSSDHKSKSSEHKHHSSKSHSSASSHKTSSSSHKRSREDAESKENESNAKKLKSDHDKSDSKKSSKSNGSSSEKKESSSNSNSNGTSSKSKKKDHKSSSSSSSKKRKHSSNEDPSQEFDGTQGIGFAEALASFDMPSSSSKHKKHDQLADKIVSVKTSSSQNSSSKSKSSSGSSSSQHRHKKDREKDKSSSSSAPSTSNSLPNFTQPPPLLTQKPKLDLFPDIVSELPNDVSIPDYRPTPLNSVIKDYILGSGSSQSRHTKVMSDYDLLTESFSSKANRTRVFSGNSKARSEIPKLFEMCIRVLQENIDYLETTGGVPFEILKPVLERAKPEQLSNIEYYNPYLLEESDVLWQPHCQRKWKSRKPLEMETWREMYERCTREDDEKLSRLTQNIRQQQVITSNGIQKTKMAFVDSMVKPPRGMMRKQEQFGTNRKLVASPAARTEGLKNMAPNIAAPGDVRLRVVSGLRDDAQQVVGRGNMQRANLTKKAPMMAKILSKFKR